MSPVFTLPTKKASCMRWNRHTPLRLKGGWATLREREAAASLDENSIDSEETDNYVKGARLSMLFRRPQKILCNRQSMTV